MLSVEIMRELLDRYGVWVVLGISVLVPTLNLIITIFSYLKTRRQLKQSFNDQRLLLHEQFDQQRKMRDAQFREADAADRAVVMDYIGSLLARTSELASLQIYGFEGYGAGGRPQFEKMQKFMLSNEMHPAFPERNRGMWCAFLLFQLISAYNIASNARWQRALSKEQSEFLSWFDNKIVPALCSTAFPGIPLFYREHLEVISEEMLVKSKATGVVRPMHWAEFCERIETVPYFKLMAEEVAQDFRRLTDEGLALPRRRAFQARLGILSLYLIRTVRDHGGDSSMSSLASSVPTLTVGTHHR